MAQHSPLVSIIVPVYNAALFLPKCIESLRRQTYKNIEIILVHDGGTDSSLAICKMYENTDNRIVLLDKQNEGVSAARNDALQMAKGEFIQFVDSDDWLSENATELLVKRIMHAGSDLVISDFYRVYKDSHKILGLINEECELSVVEYAVKMMDKPSSFYYGVLWNKLYKAQLIKTAEIRCNETLIWSEDFLFNLDYLKVCKKVSVLKQPIYFYQKNEKSITASRMSPVNAAKTKAVIFRYYKELYDSMGLLDDNKLKIYKYLIDTAECT